MVELEEMVVMVVLLELTGQRVVMAERVELELEDLVVMEALVLHTVALEEMVGMEGLAVLVVLVGKVVAHLVAMVATEGMVQLALHPCVFLQSGQ
jgi:hypothetical protein